MFKIPSWFYCQNDLLSDLTFLFGVFPFYICVWFCECWTPSQPSGPNSLSIQFFLVLFDIHNSNIQSLSAMPVARSNPEWACWYTQPDLKLMWFLVSSEALFVCAREREKGHRLWGMRTCEREGIRQRWRVSHVSVLRMLSQIETRFVSPRPLWLTKFACPDCIF